MLRQEGRAEEIRLVTTFVDQRSSDRFPESFLMLKTQKVTDVFPESIETIKEAVQMEDMKKEDSDEEFGVEDEAIKLEKEWDKET